MFNKKLIVLAIIIVFLISGCVEGEETETPPEETPTPTVVCTEGQTKVCTTSENCPGARICANNAWGACYDIPKDNCPTTIICTHGETKSCTTTDNCPGTQLCVDNVWTACYDNPDDDCPASSVCTEGETRACTTLEDCPGTQTCTNNAWGNCIDNPGDSCPEGPVPFFDNASPVMYFFTDTCGRCVRQKGILAELAPEGYRVKPMNVTANYSLKTEYNITGWPTFITANGTKKIGIMYETELRQFLDDHGAKIAA